jgi:membrane protease YdiL (CAAX protease family)
VRPLSIYIVAVVTAVVLARTLPAFAVWPVVAASIIAPVVVLVRSRDTGTPILLGTAGVRGALVAALVAIVTAAALTFGALELSHGRLTTWSLFQVPPLTPRTLTLALVLPNAIAAAIVFQAWLQTRIALVAGRWGAVFATALIYALADRSPFAFLVAFAPAVARAENGSLPACICAYVVLGIVAALGR